MAVQRPKTWIWYLLAVVFALAAGLSAHAYLVAQNRTEEVVVAKATIPPMAELDPALLGTARLPASAVPADAFRRVADAAGLYTQVGVVRGAVVTRSMTLSLAAPGAPGPGSQWAAKLVMLQRQAATRGLEAFPLPLDQNGGYTLVQAGDRADVMATVGGAGQGGAKAGIVVADVLVLGKLDQSTSNANVVNMSNGGQTTTSTSGVVVLAVTPADAQRILAAEAASQKLVLALANPAARDLPRPGAPASADGLFGGAGAPAGGQGQPGQQPGQGGR